MTPAFAHGSVALCAVTRAVTGPSPASGCETRWNWSLVPQMSPPPPWTVQVPLASSVWAPAGVAPPTSVQLQPLGQSAGGVGAPVATATVSNVTALRAPALCDVTARPASIAVAAVIVTLDPATGVHVAPSAEVYAVNVAPDRATRTNAGAAPAGRAGWSVRRPSSDRYWTASPLPGVTNRA